jgi:hypothetical protein
MDDIVGRISFLDTGQIPRQSLQEAMLEDIYWIAKGDPQGTNYAEIGPKLEYAISVGLHESDVSIIGRKRIRIHGAELVRELCELYGVEIKKIKN